MSKLRTDVLIVDDSATMRKIVRVQLGELGFRSIQDAEHGQHAITLMKGWTPDIILSDYDMSPVNGSQLLTYVRADSRLARVPFVMITAFIARFSDSGRDGGITHYLAKPFHPQELDSKISAALVASGRKAA